MLRDVFYYGEKPNVHPRERKANNLEHATELATTEHFWIISEHCNYKNFDWDWAFEFLPDEDVWAENHINIWPSPYQKDSGTWLVSKNHNNIKIYRADVDPISLKDEIVNNWVFLHDIVKKKFDFKWHPDPTDPPYIYVFGNKWYPATVMPTVEYHVDGATERKYVDDQIAELVQWPALFNVIHPVIEFDYSWRPDPTSPPYIYVWGNSQYPATIMPTIEYHVEGATERKYLENIRPKLAPKPEDFIILDIIDINSFDFSWKPNPTSPPYIYVWGNQWHKPEDKVSLMYKVENATEYKYMDERVKKLPKFDNWQIPSNMLEGSFDFSWEPNPHDPPFIYMFGTQHQKTGGPAYVVPNATQIKYIDEPKCIVKCDEFKKWLVPRNIDQSSFDFSWHPDSTEPTPYIYQFPDQWSRTGGPRYVMENATEIKYMEYPIAVAKPDFNHWRIPDDVIREEFDFSWHPDIEDKPYIYKFGTQHQKTGGPIFISYGLQSEDDIKYIDTIKAKVKSHPERFIVNDDVVDFDYSWHPDETEPPYIYVWGNKHYGSDLKPTVEYHVEGATQIKHMDQNVKLKISSKLKTYYEIDKNKFDLTYRPDPTSPPYIYVWGNKHIPAELKPTVEFYVEGATEYKYMHDIVDVLPEFDRWREYQIIDRKKFDLTWRPDPREPDYIYVWGNKYIPGELKPTLEYHCPNATERKYMGDIEVLPEYDKYKIIHKPKNFDFSWRPDPREPAYIYVWGNKYILGEIEPTLEYHCPGATERKYMGDLDVEPEYERWNIVQQVDQTFDLAWRPDPREPPYIYVWGNKYIPGELLATIEYHVPGATEKKYMGDAPVVSEKDRWKITQDIDISKFDLTWRPDPREPPYIYTWGNKHISAELLPTIEYFTPGASERKYMGNVDVIPEFNRWVEVQLVDKNKFDLTWRPDPREPPYIYVWGNKHIPAELKSTIEYHTPNAIDKKYMGDVDVLPLSENYKITQPVVNFDFTWRPDPREPDYIYVWGNEFIPAEVKPTVEYYCPGATQKKYMGNIEVAPEWDKYKILIPIDKNSFNFAWRPDPREPPYIYVWGNQSYNAEVEPTIEYHCIGATERKYMNDQVASTLPDIENFKILIPVSEFNYSWRPDPHSPPYIYVFGNQWHDAITEPTIEYHVPGATQRKYVNDIVAKVSATQEHWKTLLPVDNFDYSWRPDPNSPPYIYVFGNQWNPIELEHTVEYHTPNAVDIKYITDIKAILKSTSTDIKWKRLLDIESFDYSWRPDPREPALIYVFGNKWNNANTEPTIEYHCEGATERKYLDNPVATPRAELEFWSISNNDDLDTFDFTWRPNPHSPPQIYQWADNGPRYTVPGATEVVLMERNDDNKRKSIARYKIKTTLEDLINEHIDEVFWALNPDLNYDKFDFNWRPTEETFRHINVFGNEYSKDTQTYYINGPMYQLGYKEYNYVEGNLVKIESNLSMFFVDKGNNLSQLRFDELKIRFPKLQKTRYLNTWVDTINRCINKSETKLCWIVSSELDYSEFEFDFYPSPWQEKMVHVFGTQHSHWGNTYMVNKEWFGEDTKYVKIIEHLSGLNFVKSKKAKATDVIHEIIYIDHGNMPAEIKDLGYTIIPYNNTYLKTFQDILAKLPNKKEHFIWVMNSICDYTNFDFTYICDPFAREQLHVFPSDKQKFGDTFFINVNELRKQIDNMTLLEDYNKINYNQHMRVPRLPAPEFVLQDDTLVNSVKYNYNFPYAVFKTHDNSELKIKDHVPISLWSDDTKNILITSTGGSRIVVPKEAKDYVDSELYDYPYIIKSEKLAESNPLDIVYLSNGEARADENYEHLQYILKGKPNRLIRVDGVNGRVNAYHAAAEASNTPWMFTVFAKLLVSNSFDWNWQPDRLQIPKHYIFHATNILNDLEYGHQAMIAYNKKLVLNNIGKGLDFTLDDEHEVIKMNSGVALFNTDEFSTWRTAFREVIKLRNDNSKDSAMRLQIWCTVAHGDYAQFCLDGARHALEYYDEVNGDIEKLRLSYEWDWCLEKFNKKYE